MEYEFLKHLQNELNQKSDLSCVLKHLNLPQISEGIEFNNGLILSIQGSYGHYCLPRKTLPYDQYTRMEVALYTEKGFANIEDYLDTKEFDEYFNGSVYGYVPVVLIEKLYQALKNKFGIRE